MSSTDTNTIDAATDDVAAAEEASKDHLDWYIVNTYSGQENRAKLTLLERVKKAGLDEVFGDVLIPTENVMEVVKGQKRTTTRKFYPGYMFVQMQLSDQTFSLVKNTPKITGFLGGRHPSPVSTREITSIHSAMTEGRAKPKTKVAVAVNDNVRVNDGAFANAAGVVKEVNAEKEKVKVEVAIFGRTVAVELSFTQIEKA